MLPDYVDTKEQLQNVLNRWVRRRVREHLGPFGESPRYTVFEGTGTSIIRANNREDVSPMLRIESEFEVKFDEVPTLTLIDILRSLDEVAQKIADQMAKHAYSSISEAAERVGNVVKAAGKITPEVILELFDKIEIEFDDNGNPEFPSIHIHPDVAETLKEALAQLQEIPENRQRFEAILAIKKEKRRVREANRKLVG
jgi:hypothetical protein